MTVIQEFQAVVFAAGKGSRMPELTVNKPKCLLPVGNKPLVWYSLYRLQKMGFQDVILIVFETQKSEIQAAIDKLSLQVKIDYFTISPNEDLGTADSLRLLGDKLKSNVMAMSCDVITDVDLSPALDLFRKHRAAICTVFYNPEAAEVKTAAPGPKSKHKTERDLVGVDAQTERLVFFASASDFETSVPFSSSLIKKHPHIRIYSRLIDLHVYFIRNWVVKYLQHETSMSTLKGELLPHIVKKQSIRRPIVKEAAPSLVQPDNTGDILHFASESDLDLLVRQKSAFNDHHGDSKSCYHDDLIRCYAHIADSKSIGLRINTLPSYWNINTNKANKAHLRVADGGNLVRLDPKSEIKSSQVDEECVVWESARLSEKTSFVNANVGPNSEVQSFSRVSNSVVMNNVTIKSRVVLENCIVCDGAVIEEETKLKNCIVGSNHVVPKSSEHANEVLTLTDQLMEFE